ncbi:MAG: glutathione S-transferase N-terminal domain-containing protein [Yoonia sp.]|uniref:glutathione S-transferase family protein n=1 Tax=Yoonia sp. TaxID=2212373 RepID=UPI0032644DD5
MTDDLVLHYAPDNASLCVRLLLAEMDIPHRLVLVDRAAKEQRSAAYLAMNPNGLIPTLETPDGPLFETAAILLWLADQRPGTVFPAPDTGPRGIALTRLFWLSNTVHPALRMLFYPDVYMASDPAGLRQQARLRLTSYFTQLDTHWDNVACPALACYLAPMLRWCALYGGDTTWFDLSKWPTLHNFAVAYENRPLVSEVCQAEGLGQTPFSRPCPARPPEGSAT